MLGAMVKYFEERARTAVKTLIIFSAKGSIFFKVKGRTDTSRSKLFSISSIEIKMMD
jgi:hypothetical protein